MRRQIKEIFSNKQGFMSKKLRTETTPYFYEAQTPRLQKVNVPSPRIKKIQYESIKTRL
jgi:hypothetical protein